MTAFDLIPLWMVLLGSVISMVAFIEVGFKLASNMKGKPVKAQTAQVRAIMGASLGLLAFMLAFSFSMAQRHFEVRTQSFMLEVNAISSAYRGTDLLDDVTRPVAKNLLRQFVAIRMEMIQLQGDSSMTRVLELVKESIRLHDRLWSLAESSMENPENSESTGIFSQSVLAMINAQDARLQAVLYNRISPVIWITLFVMALLSMMIMGYQAGLTGARSGIATWTLAVTFSVVMALVMDLDRPNQRLFSMNQQMMVELHNRMQADTRVQQNKPEPAHPPVAPDLNANATSPLNPAHQLYAIV